MCLPISYPEGRKDVGELEKLLRSDLPYITRMYRRCTQEKRPSLSQEWPEVRGMDQGSRFLIEDQQEVGNLDEDLSDQSEEPAVTPHCSYQPDARIIQSGTFLAKQPHEGGKLWSCKVPTC
ncbi:hypothetical protein Bca52824_016886 [Brassica carinata]|uniref:Uncharacterized protein n=1 Tax=Brassica carinata TaxID=52824 RepID=A0A8X7W4C8_BRACI|nr:hypothetical protein Bca52824_016886 [Brassica carinata]